MNNYYYGLARQTLKEGMAYRTNFILSFLVVLIPLLGQLLLVRFVYQNGSSLGSWELSSLLAYFLLARVTSEAFSITTWWDIKNDIKNGGLNNHLLKPYRYFWHNFTVYYTLKSISISVAIIITYATYVVVRGSFLVPIDFISLIQFLVLSVVAAILSFLLIFWLSILAFFFLEIRFVENLLSILLPFMTGSILPLDIFPGVCRTILLSLPPAYLVYYPARILTRSMPWPDFLILLSQAVLWVLVVWIALTTTWRKGIMKYEATG